MAYTLVTGGSGFIGQYLVAAFSSKVAACAFSMFGLPHQLLRERNMFGVYQISVEIEQNFLGMDDSRPSQPPPPQARFRPIGYS